MQIEITDNREAQRFEAYVDATFAGLIAYSIANGQITLSHTEIEAAFEGKGAASTLVRRALDMVRDAGLALLPECPFVRAYVQRHPEYLDLVPAPERARFKLPAAGAA